MSKAVESEFQTNTGRTIFILQIKQGTIREIISVLSQPPVNAEDLYCYAVLSEANGCPKVRY